MKFCYLNVEDLASTGYLEDCISIIEREYDHRVEITAVSCTDEHLVLRIEADDFGEIKDFCSFLSSSLLELGIYQFSIKYQP